MARLDFIVDTSVSTPGRRYAGYFSTLVSPLDGQVRNDKVLEISVQPVQPNPNGDTLFVADHLASDTYQVAIGLADQAPTSGTFKLTVGVTTTNLTALAYNISAAALQTPLSAAFVAEGESACTVTAVATGVYQVVATSNGAVAAGFLVSDAANLLPTSGVIVIESDLGSASKPYRYLIAIRQQPMCLGAPATQLTSITVTAASEQAMSATANQISSIAFNVDPVGGTYNLTLSALGVSRTFTVPAVITADGLAAILAQHPKIVWTEAGDPDNNIAVTKTGSKFYVQFYGTLAAKKITGSSVDAGAFTTITTETPHGYVAGMSVTHSSTNSTPNTDGAQTVVSSASTTTYVVGVDVTVAGTAGVTRDASAPSITVSDNNLVGPKGVSGTISLNTENLYVYSVGQTANVFDLFFTITRTRASGEVRTIFGPAAISLSKDIVDPATMVPTPLPSYYTAAQSDARYGQLAASNTWTGAANNFTLGGVGLGAAASNDGQLYVYNENNSFYYLIQGAGTPGADRTLTFPDLSGTFALVNAAQSWTAAQTYGDGYLKLSGATSGASTLKAPAIASNYVHTLPDVTTTIMGWQDALRKDFIFLRDDFIGGSNASFNYGAIGEMAWSAGNIVAANATDYVAGEANHWGIVRVKSGATSGNGATLSLNFGASFSETGRFPALNATTGWKLRFIVRPESITSVDMRIGLTDDFNGDPPSNGIWWEFESASDTKWTPVCRSGGVETEGSTTNSVNAGAGTWVTLDIYCDSSGTISFSADGGTAITVATNVPSANLSPCLIVKTGTSASRYLDIDFFAMQMTVTR